MVQLIHGNCVEEMAKLESGSVDLVVTSPPYNMQTRVRNGKYSYSEYADGLSTKYANTLDCLPVPEFYELHKEAIRQMLRLSSIVVYNIQIVTGSKEAFFRIIGDYAEYLKDIVIWDKNHAQPAMNPGCINRASELILIFESDKRAGRSLSNYNFDRGTMEDIWRIPRERSVSKRHKAVFPLALATKAVTGFSKEGATVLDPFMGSGTTGLACKNLNRNFIGIELDPEYFQLSQERLK